MVSNEWTLENFQSLDIVTIDGDRGKNYPKKEDYLESGYALFLGADNISNGKLNTEKTIFLTKEKHLAMGKGIVKDNDILLVMRGNGTGRSCIFNNEINSEASRINSGLVIIRNNEKYTEVNFLHQLFSSPVIQKQFESFMFGSAQPQLTIQLLKSLKFLTPPIEEQKKIAEILSTWDKAIETVEKLIANSQQQKKALMQQLLTAQKRLLDDNGVKFKGEWGKGKLSDLANISKGKALSSKNIKSGNYPVIAGGKTSPYCHNDFTHENVVTVSASGAYAGYVAYHSSKIWASDCSVITEKGNSDIKFIFQLLSYLQSTIYSLQSGGAQPHVYPKDLEIIEVGIPSKKEQEKIAQVLTLADQQIDLYKEQLDKLKLEKKSLMQQLLTGQKRVKID